MTPEEIKEKVSHCFKELDINCAETILTLAAEYLDVNIHPQTRWAAKGMHGAGGFRAQCGLVEGMLMLFGVLGGRNGAPAEEISEVCKRFAAEFEKEFSSLVCRELRPEGFHPDNPPHLCEPLTNKVVAFAIEFLESEKAGTKN